MFCIDIRQIYQYLLDSFTEVWEIKYGNIAYVAAVVFDLQKYHPDFAIAVVDQVLEDIRVGMEVSGSRRMIIFVKIPVY